MADVCKFSIQTAVVNKIDTGKNRYFCGQMRKTLEKTSGPAFSGSRKKIFSENYIQAQILTEYIFIT